jgi:hypothetical protein
MLLTEESKGYPSGSKKEKMAEWLVDHGAQDEGGNVYTLDDLLQKQRQVPMKSRRLDERGFVFGFEADPEVQDPRVAESVERADGH